MQTFTREKNFFGFHPLSFVDDVINSSNDFCGDALDALEDFLVAHLGEVHKDDVEQVRCACNKKQRTDSSREQIS